MEKTLDGLLQSVRVTTKLILDEIDFDSIKDTGTYNSVLIKIIYI